MPRFDDNKAHYDSLISLFKYIITIALSLFTIFGFIIGYITYTDGKEMREDLKARKAELREDAKVMKQDAEVMKQDLKEREIVIVNELKLLSDKVNNQILVARQDALNEVSNIKNQASILAQSEARNKINEVFDNKNLNEFVERIAEERIKPQINNLVDQQIAENIRKETEIAFQNLMSSDYLKRNQGLNYLIINRNIQLSDGQLKKISELINDESYDENYKPSLNVILLSRESSVITEFYKKVLSNYDQGEVINTNNYQTIISAYQYFFLHNIQYDFLVEHFEKGINTQSSKVDAFISLLPSLCTFNKAYVLRFLNEKSLCNKVKNTISAENLKGDKDLLKLNLSCLSETEMTTTYFFKL